jgi:hypothetical protein
MTMDEREVISHRRRPPALHVMTPSYAEAPA